MAKYIIAFLMCLIIIWCVIFEIFTNTNPLDKIPFIPSISITEIFKPATTRPEETSVEEMVNKGAYMLRRSFGFYKGSKKMSEIRTIAFSRETPEYYDECWNANIADTGHIKGYLIGNDVVIVGEYIYANKASRNMFAAHNSYGEPLWSNLKEINGLELLNTSRVEDMTMMFAFNQLTELNGIDEWDVSNVKTFAGMFQGNDNSGDIKLKYLDVGKWDTSSAENMSHMFYGCALMEHIPIENWDVSKVKTFSHMFADCHSLKGVNFSKWDTSSVESFDGFLNDCRSLIIVDVSNFKTKTCKQFSQMFEACINLEYIIGLDKWDVSNANYYAFSETFHCCYKLKEVNIGNWITTPDNTARMFKNCYSLTEIDLSGFDMTNTEHTTEMFMNCNAIIKR